MYSYEYDTQTGGILLNSTPLMMSKEPRPVYYKELDILRFDKFWNYEKDDTYPYMWAEANNYYYRGRKVAQTKGGSCYTAPEIVILEEPEPNGEPLKFVDIDAMVEKNRPLLESLVQETIKNTYNAYVEYKDKVDIFHVSYSGGKDSEVAFDIVQRALPHDEFVVIFGDTKMEFPDTYKVIEKTKEFCQKNHIEFYTASTDFDPKDSWNTFGAPSSAMRWCCGVHKTAPQLLKIREILGKSDVREMAFVGIRSSESVRRSGYDYISFGTKHSGQSSCNPILEWNSAEVYLYMYMQGLYINDAYKKGSSRAGCLFCPMAALRSDYFNYTLYPDKVQPFIDTIKTLYTEGANPKLADSYVEKKGWKARKNGRDFTIGIDDFDEETIKKKRVITFKPKGDSWIEWMKTVGYLEIDNQDATIRFTDNSIIKFFIKDHGNGYLSLSFDEDAVKYNLTKFRNIKNVLKKAHCCVACRYCEANCPHGNISFVDGMVSISDNCIKCGLCNKIDNGCLVYNSLLLPKGNGKMRKGSIDEYATHHPSAGWLNAFIESKEMFSTTNNCGYNKPAFSMYNKFLRDAGLITSKSLEPLANILFERGIDDEVVWGLMFANLAYAPQIGWLVDNIQFNTTYTQAEIKSTLESYITTATGPRNITRSYGNIAKLPISAVGFGNVISESKNGFEFIRTPWQNPDPRVILYSLYKFAEECGDYYQFTLSRLLNHEIDSDGVSPTQIFGLDREKMEQLLNGLSINYPNFINVSFTHDLDNITLRSEKTSKDVLSLF